MSDPVLFTPLSLRGVTFKNRIVVSPMCQYAAVDGLVGDWHLAHHARFALGGVGGAVVEATGVTPDGRITQGCLGLWDDAQIGGMARIVDLYHKRGAVVGVQLGHAGRKSSASLPWDGNQPLATVAPAKAWQTYGPSAVPHAEGWPTPLALGIADIERLVEAFADATRRAVAAGFDFVEIHGAHGYLIHSFLAPLSNLRDDRYGGDLAGRMRFAVDIASAVRAALPGNLPLFYRASCTDTVAGGITLDDTIQLATALKTRGVDVIDCSSGGLLGAVSIVPATQPPDFQIAYANAIRHATGLPTMAVGQITTPAQAEAILADGRADLVAIGRELLVDSNFAFRAAVDLGLEEPESVFDETYRFFLSRRRLARRAAVINPPSTPVKS